MQCLSGFELYSRWVPLSQFYLKMRYWLLLHFSVLKRVGLNIYSFSDDRIKILGNYTMEEDKLVLESSKFVWKGKNCYCRYC